MAEKILTSLPDGQPALFLLERKISSSATPPLFDYPLESLRGVAAMLVVLFHLFLRSPALDPHYALKGIWQYQAPGHLSVIVFFMLSGYVIGLTNAKPIKTWQARLSYLKKRFVRLYPLYVLAVLAAVLVAALFRQAYRPGEITGWLLFLQGLVVQVPEYNGPLWSLSYEVAYYLLFLLLSACHIRVGWLTGALVGVALLLTKTHTGPPVIISYLYGAVFWLVGLWLNESVKKTKAPQYGTMFALLLLLLSFDRMNIGSSLLQALKLNVSQQEVTNFYDRPIVFSDLSLLLLGIPLLTCFTNRHVPGQRYLEYLAFAIPGVYLTLYVVSKKIYQVELFNTLFLNLVFYITALLVYIFRFIIKSYGKAVLQKLLPTGYVSYGLYIIHFPLLSAFSRVTYCSGSGLTLAVRLLVYGAVLTALAWWLERRFQPWIRQRLLSWL